MIKTTIEKAVLVMYCDNCGRRIGRYDKLLGVCGPPPPPSELKGPIFDINGCNAMVIPGEHGPECYCGRCFSFVAREDHGRSERVAFTATGKVIQIKYET